MDLKLKTALRKKKTLHCKKITCPFKTYASYIFFDKGLQSGSLSRTLTSKTYDSACQQHDSADHWYLGSIAQVTFTTVDFAFGDFRWGGELFAILLAAFRWSGTSFEKDFICHAWGLSFDIKFATTVLTVRTGYLFCVVFAVIPALRRDTLVAFQGITWKKKQKYFEPVPKEGWHRIFPSEFSHQWQCKCLWRSSGVILCKKLFKMLK